ncbi:MAG: methylhydantoinase, partial [Gammaproteobacteria bacterium]|nr:methylhydantoinase [Gammaproteobacteria bacterium]
DIALSHNGNYQTSKLLTTHHNPVQGVLSGAEIALNQAGVKPQELGAVIHGTTLATNALIERRGAKVGAIVTEGFRDILEIAYERRYDQYDLYIEKPDMIVPRHLVKTVPERVTADGKIKHILDHASVELAIADLIEEGIESLAVCLLHSYKNAAHEQAILNIVQQFAPDLPVSLSCQVSPEIREYDRLCTTVGNAYIKPLMTGYLKNLSDTLVHQGFNCPLYLMTSGGGMTTLKTAMNLPIRLVESGPSGGALLAASVASSCDLEQVLSFDMGGTTAKVCLIENGEPRTSRAFEVGRAERFIKGSGLPVRIPVIEMIEIGAGGGSIASIDAIHQLKVGPQSASSDPGPACYGKGGQSPTVTDADALIGFMDPQSFAEGRLHLDIDLAEKVLEDSICRDLNIPVSAAADGISQVVDEAMANAARIHAAEQGKNLEDCVMIAFGGNGPLHATRVAEKIGIRKIIIPPQPGVGSALGFLKAPVSFEVIGSYYVLIEDCDITDLDSFLEQMETEASNVVRAGANGNALTLKRTAFMRYRGQGHEIEVDIPSGSLDRKKIQSLIGSYKMEYKRQFGRVVPGMKIEVMNWSIRVATQPALVEKIPANQSNQQAASASVRSLYPGQTGQQVDATVYYRDELKVGDFLVGPALVIEAQTTTFVSESFEASIDKAGNIILRRRKVSTTNRNSINRAAIDYQVMWNRLLAIVEEQGQVLIRTAFSPIVRECGDISAGIFAADGRMLAQAVTGTPGHINTMAAAVGLMLDHVPAEDMNPGDIYMTNDPWLASGHLNDVLLVAPVFYSGLLVAFTACTSHLYDLGGLGMGPQGSDIHDEGLIIPPLKLCDHGEVSQLFVDILKANSRTPESNEGDLYALI